MIDLQPRFQRYRGVSRPDIFDEHDRSFISLPHSPLEMVVPSSDMYFSQGHGIYLKDSGLIPSGTILDKGLIAHCTVVIPVSHALTTLSKTKNHHMIRPLMEAMLPELKQSDTPQNTILYIIRSINKGEYDLYKDIYEERLYDSLVKTISVLRFMRGVDQLGIPIQKTSEYAPLLEYISDALYMQKTINNQYIIKYLIHFVEEYGMQRMQRIGLTTG